MKDLHEIVNKVKNEIARAEDMEGLCYYASNNIIYDLKSNGINAEMFNVRDLADIDYDHYFVIASLENPYLIDLTFKQFIKQDNKKPRFFEKWPSDILDNTEEGKELLKTLITEGYSFIDDNAFYQYIHAFNEQIEPFFSVEDIVHFKTK